MPDQHPENKLGRLIRRLQSRQDFPAISKHISEINLKASPSGLSNAIQLAELIVKDFSLTSKLLKLVNSAYYGQFSGQISSVSRAVVILGFEQVRMATASLLFLEHLQDRAQAVELERAILAAFVSGVVARDLAGRLKIQEAEEVLVCAMFHNLGRLLSLFHFPEQAMEIQRLQEEEKVGEQQACRQALGVTYTELGQEVGRLWNLPASIISSMAGIHEPKASRGKTRADLLRMVTSFANELCEIALYAPAEQKQKRLNRLIAKYQQALPFSKEQVMDFIDAAIDNVREFSEVIDLKKRQAAMLRTMSFRDRPGKDFLPANETVEELDALQPPTGLDHPAAVATALDSGRQLQVMTALQDITTGLLDEDVSLDSLLALALQAAHDGLGFSPVLLCVADPKTKMMQARFVVDEHREEILRKFKFPLDLKGKDIFNRALAENRDVFVHNLRHPSILPLLPAWYKGILRAETLLLYPLVVRKVPIGLLYAAYREPGQTIGLDQLNHLKMLRNQIVLGIAQKGG